MMSNKLDNLEIVHEGWLTKSPPTTRIWRARWRKRWFILRHSGELPGQYFLCYYTDRNCRKLKGQIDLDQCEQVDAGLRFENRKQKYQYMFNIRTPKRMYYLAAETENDMNKWVDCICHVCGLKPFISEDTVTEYDGDNISQATTGITEISPPVTPRTIISGPYIPISECISGKPINSPDEFKQFLLSQSKPKLNDRESYDIPRKLKPTEVNIETCTPPPSPGSESVFTDDESVQKPTKKPSVNWETFPRQSESSLEEEPGSKGTMVKVNRRFTKSVSVTEGIVVHAPPRPPKPAHLITNDNDGNISNAQESTDTIVDNCEVKIVSIPDNGSPIKIEIIGSDEMYDIPRSHNVNDHDTMTKLKQQGKHSYTNAAPSQTPSGNFFRYDFPSLPISNSEELPESPRSETSSITSNTISHSNLPSPSYSITNQIIPTPPAVNRELKPGRRLSDSTGGSNEPSPSPLLPLGPPNIDRKLKPAPLKKIHKAFRNDTDKALKLSSPPAGSLGRRKQRTGPHPATPTTPGSNSVSNKVITDNGFNTTGRMHRRHSSSDDRLTSVNDEIRRYCVGNEEVYSRNPSFKRPEDLHYLDLDLDSSENGNTLSPNSSGLVKKSSENLPTPSTATVYKTVDFLKTEAFNRTRIEIEEERSRLCLAAESPS